MHVTKIKLYVSYVLLMCTGINRKIGCLYVYMHMCGFIQNVKHFVTYKIIIAIISFVTPLILISSGNHGDFRKSSCFQNLLRLLCWKAITAFFSPQSPILTWLFNFLVLLYSSALTYYFHFYLEPNCIFRGLEMPCVIEGRVRWGMKWWKIKQMTHRMMSRVFIGWENLPFTKVSVN